MKRRIQVERRTLETEVKVDFCIDGSGKGHIDTGIGFFDHMLILFARHGFFDLELEAKGDTCVDFHHTVEDVAITLGQAILRALGDKKGISRYSTVFTPMDESLSRVAIDISGRPFIVFDVEFTAQKIGDFDTELVEEFFRAVSVNGGITLHMDLLRGKNNHHIAESIFKGFGRALDRATVTEHRLNGVMSTKGILG